MVVAGDKPRVLGEQVELRQRSLDSRQQVANLGEAGFELRAGHAGLQQIVQPPHAGGLGIVKVGEAIDFFHRANEAEPFPATNGADGHVERSRQHGRRVEGVHFAAPAVESQQPQPVGLADDPQRQAFLLQPRRLLHVERGVPVGLQRPALFADNEHRGLPADVLGGRAAVLLGQLVCEVRHRGQRAGEGNPLSGQTRRTADASGGAEDSVSASVLEASVERVLLITSASWCTNSGRRLLPAQLRCRSYQGETVSR